jgi:hypothetical protein
MERRDEGGVGLALAEALIELLAEGGRQASDFTFSNHPGRSIPFKVGDVKGLNAPNARKRGEDRLGQTGAANNELNHGWQDHTDGKGFGRRDSEPVIMKYRHTEDKQLQGSRLTL